MIEIPGQLLRVVFFYRAAGLKKEKWNAK